MFLVGDGDGAITRTSSDPEAAKLAVCAKTGITRPECGCLLCHYRLQLELLGPEHPAVAQLIALVER